MDCSDHEIDLIYDKIDGLLLSGKFEEVDEILAGVAVDDAPLAILLAFLTITLPAREKLAMRQTFFNRVRESLIRQGKLKGGLLDGL